MNRPNAFLIVFSATLLLTSCGNSGDTKSSDTGKDSSSSTTTTSPTSATPGEKGLELIGASDCTTCHKVHKEDVTGSTIGPAYIDVATKYSPAADTTVNRLVKKIITGGSGVWGTIPMTPHPAVKEEDVRTMVAYILNLKK